MLVPHPPIELVYSIEFVDSSNINDLRLQTRRLVWAKGLTVGWTDANGGLKLLISLNRYA